MPFSSRIKYMEFLLVLHDNKKVSRLAVDDADLRQAIALSKTNNLFIEISDFKVSFDRDLNYVNKGIIIPNESTTAGVHYIYISKDKNLANQAKTFEKEKDHVRLGRLLGYPDCCTEFFANAEPKRSVLDNDYLDLTLDNSKGNSFRFYINLFQRGNDLLLVSHFPCSLNCKQSLIIGMKNLELLKSIWPEYATECTNLKGDYKFKNRIFSFY